MDFDTPSPSRGETTPQSGHLSGIGTLATLEMYGSSSSSSGGDEDAVVTERPRRAASDKGSDPPSSDDEDDEDYVSDTAVQQGHSSDEEDKRECRPPPEDAVEDDDVEDEDFAAALRDEDIAAAGHWRYKGKSALRSDRIQVLDMEGLLVEELKDEIKTVGDAWRFGGREGGRERGGYGRKMKHVFSFSSEGSNAWTAVGEEVIWGTSKKKRAPALDDKQGWIKRIPVGNLPPRFRLDDRGRQRKIAYVFIHYLGKPPPP